MTELHTAVVFHSMRVAEHGLRVLAKKVRVSLDLRDKKGIVPVEYADWQKMITAFKNKLGKISALPTGPKRGAQLEKYSDAAESLCVYERHLAEHRLTRTQTIQTCRSARSAREGSGFHAVCG